MLSAPLPPSPLVLVGFMGSGKTTVGRELAQRLGWYFCDLDDRIEAAAGASIASIFATRGETAFRELEHRELLQALGETRRRHTVLALGGGTFAQPLNQEPIRAGGACTVFLDVPVDELLLRCAGMSNRPLFRDEASFRALHAQRVPFYRQATLTLAAGATPPALLSERILEQIQAVRPA
ncbi:MAG: shikimate kinase [Terriglobales bacterium]